MKFFKRTILFALCILMLFALISCGSSTDSKSSNAVTDASASGNAADTAAKKASTGSFDYDFSRMSESVAYSQLSNFMNSPASYVGKTVKIKGDYYITHYDETNKDYYYIILNDTTACCSAYIEFLTDGCNYPSKASDDNNKVTVTATGVIDKYDELGQTYYYLKVDSIA